MTITKAYLSNYFVSKITLYFECVQGIREWPLAHEDSVLVLPLNLKELYTTDKIRLGYNVAQSLSHYPETGRVSSFTQIISDVTLICWIARNYGSPVVPLLGFRT